MTLIFFKCKSKNNHPLLSPAASNQASDQWGTSILSWFYWSCDRTKASHCNWFTSVHWPGWTFFFFYTHQKSCFRVRYVFSNPTINLRMERLNIASSMAPSSQFICRIQAWDNTSYKKLGSRKVWAESISSNWWNLPCPVFYYIHFFKEKLQWVLLQV